MATYDITGLGTALEFDISNAQNISMIKYDGLDRIAMFWGNSTSLPFIRSFDVNTSTGTITPIGISLDIGSMGVTTSGAELAWIDNSNLIVNYNGSGSDGFLQLISVDGSGNCSLNGGALEYDTIQGLYNQVVMMDSTHALVVWADSSGDGRAQIFSVDTGAGTISAVGSSFEFDTSDYVVGDLVKLSSSKALVFYRGLNEDGYAVVLDINTSTWAVSAAGSAFEFKDATTLGNFIRAIIIDDTDFDFVGIYGDQTTTFARAYNIDNSTRAITNWGSELTLGSSDSIAPGYNISKIDSTHFLAIYTGSGNDGYATVLEMDGFGNLSKVGTEYEFDTGFFGDGSIINFGNGLFVIAWTGTANDGFIRTIQVELPATTNDSSFFAFF